MPQLDLTDLVADDVSKRILARHAAHEALVDHEVAAERREGIDRIVGDVMRGHGHARREFARSGDTGVSGSG